MIAAIISFIIFIAYLVCTVRYNKAVPSSLSVTYYILGASRDQKYPEGFNRLRASIFTFVLWEMLLLLIVPMMDMTPDNLRFLAFLCLAAIGFVGAAPEFYDLNVYRIHASSAVISATAGIAWALAAGARAGMVGLTLAAAISLSLALASRTLVSSRTFWLEMVAFGTVYFTIFLMF